MILDVIIYTMAVFGGIILGFCIKKEPVISLADSDLLVELLENYRKTCKQLDKGHRRKNRLIKRLRCELSRFNTRDARIEPPVFYEICIVYIKGIWESAYLDDGEWVVNEDRGIRYSIETFPFYLSQDQLPKIYKD